LVPTALAAERLREGAGVPAAALAMVAAGPVLAAGAGAATAMFTLLLACSLWAYAARRWAWSVVLLPVVIAGGTDEVAARSLPLLHQPFAQLRVALGAAVVALPLLLLRPYSRRFLVPALGFCAVGMVALVTSTWVTLLPICSPILSVLAGLGLARLPLRLRDVLLSLLVAAECHTAWILPES